MFSQTYICFCVFIFNIVLRLLDLYVKIKHLKFPWLIGKIAKILSFSKKNSLPKLVFKNESINSINICVVAQKKSENM